MVDSHQAELEEETRVEASQAYNILDELEQEGKISPEKARLYKQKFYVLHEACIKNMQNERKLSEKISQLKKSLSNETLRLEKAEQQKTDHEYKLRTLDEKFDAVKKDTIDVDERINLLLTEIHQLSSRVEQTASDFAQAEQQKRDELEPRIREREAQILKLKEELEHDDLMIKKTSEANDKLENDHSELNSRQEDLTNQIKQKQEELMKEAQEPVRITKHNESTSQGVGKLEDELKKLHEVKKRHEFDMKTLNNKLEIVKKKEGDLMEELKQAQAEEYSNLQQKMDSENHRKELAQRNNDAQEQNSIIQNEITEAKAEKKKIELQIKQVKKKHNDFFQQYTNMEKETRQLVGQQQELTTMTSGVVKMTNELGSEQNKLEHSLNNYQEDQMIYVGQLVKKGLDLNVKKHRIDDLQSQIETEEQFVKEMQAREAMLIVQINFLMTIRAKMARTASQAATQARETGAELKVKELLILDLTKKQQDTDFKLNTFIALYEEVKNARNKYVSQIQASSQDLAEMKERIKILQNEVDILQTESAEKDHDLIDIHQKKVKEMTRRDKYRSELNREEHKFRQRLSTIGQLINQGDKLNLIINSLQKEMNNLIYEYEHACESRNYMGIQLIDRNDELCILYEKSNIQENILKNGEQKIREKEETIRMINLELKERQRQYGVVGKQIPEVPKLAEKVVQLNEELEAKKHEVQTLSESLEDPANHPNAVDLPGEDPDQEALLAKIHVLEERLNNKKEALLEKELVFEEVSNLAEKLRTQALDGRKTTLEVAEKINEYKARTTDLSRKMLATVSELSMFQSKALKLQQEKEEKDSVLEGALQNLDSGMPPTEDSEMEWQKVQRNTQRRRQEGEERRQRKALEAQLTPAGVKTSALPRPNSYMPPDIQIPRPYGLFAPYKPSEPGAQMRHIIKPVLKDIEY